MIGPYYVGDIPRDPISLTVVRDDQVVDLTGYTSGTVELENPAGVAIDTSGVNVTLSATAATITWPQAGSLFTTPGLYTMQLILHTATASERSAVASFEVRADADEPVGAWATASDVLTFTGVRVDGQVLTQAQSVIELFAGITYADSVDPGYLTLSLRDLRQLKMAVAYQAAFVAQNEGIYSRAAVQSMSQDGISVTTSQRSGGGVDETALTIAPLAKMALRMVSWKSPTKTTRVRPQRHGQFSYLEDYGNAWLRDETGDEDWQPMPGTGGMS